MAAMFRRPRPGGGVRHPPALAPSVSSFKPRAQWTNSGSSIFLYVNLPGFYRDQIEIKKDEITRTVQIQGQRPLSTYTKALFNETYRIPDSCEMTKSNTSFSHGLLTIEFAAIVEGEKPEKSVHDKGKTVQRPSLDETILGSSPSLGRKKLPDEEKDQEKAIPNLDQEEPKTYKSVLEGKKTLPAGSREKPEQKIKEEGGSPSLVRKEPVKQDKVFERKESTQLGQHKTLQRLKEEEARSSSLKPKIRAEEEKVIDSKKDAGKDKDKSGEKVKEKEFTRAPRITDNLESKVHAKAKPIVGDKARAPEKKVVATNREESELKTKDKVERTTSNGNGKVRFKQDDENKVATYKVSEREIQETVKQKIGEAGLAKEIEDVKEKVDLNEPTKEESTYESKDREKMVEKSLESKSGHEEESHKYDLSLVNVGVAAIVIMGFGAYIFVPLVKLF